MSVGADIEGFEVSLPAGAQCFKELGGAWAELPAAIAGAPLQVGFEESPDRLAQVAGDEHSPSDDHGWTTHERARTSRTAWHSAHLTQWTPAIWPERLTQPGIEQP